VLDRFNVSVDGLRPALPKVDPRARRGPLYRAYARLVGTRPLGRLSRRTAWKVDPYLMRLTGGRGGMGLLLPTALLETRGARTGRLRRNGVIYFHDGDRVIVIASKLGLPEHPAWFHNSGRTRTSSWVAGRSVPRSRVTRATGRGCGNSPTGCFPRTPPTASGRGAPVAPSRSSAGPALSAETE
jgi:hypothetical protein